jgi:superfamily II RNA helicase
MEFKGFTLDQFQIDAINAIDRGNSCVVSASTGTGKTLIAEYVINKHLPEGNVTIYTAPIKALSNQKFRDFQKDYGEENVGLLTGDHSINHTACILVMTTEIYRNMLLTNDPLLHKIKYVIFDEVHYINDIQRGVIWEESIIFSPDHVRFLALSATIPNYAEFADWIATIKNHTVETVFYGHRPVPLHHHVFDIKLGLTSIQNLEIDILKDEEYWHGVDVLHPQRKAKSHRDSKHKNLSKLAAPRHTELIPEIETKLPALYFCFSRKKTEDFAMELAKKKNYVSPDETSIIATFVRSQVTPEIANIESTKKLRSVLSKGIGFHHSGMLPALKHIVEHLFARGLIKVLYTTETFSVGINMPAKTVVFDSLEKYDGVNTRMLNAKEYFQIAGRAGRRGIDVEGTVIAMVHRKFTNLKRLQKISTVDDEPIISHFTLSVNTVLNLIANFDDETQEKILKSSFDYYTRKKEGKKNVHIMSSYSNKIKLLKKLEYITESVSGGQMIGGSYVEMPNKYALTLKGQFARHIYFNEIVLTELFHFDFLHKMSDIDLLTLLASIVYEPRRLDYFMIKGSEKHYQRIISRIEKTTIAKDINKINLKRMINFVYEWANGASFQKLMTFSNLAEGDIIRFFRRLIDTLTQLQRATDNVELKERMQKLIQLIDRDIVAADI